MSELGRLLGGAGRGGPTGIGPLTAADEGFNHQIADTFGIVGTTELAWTEKTWNCLSRRDGSLQIDVGLGRYHNRAVMDAFAGASRGREQWTVRASRELGDRHHDLVVGPISIEVIEPLRRVRYRLEPNDVVPLAFTLEFEAVLPPFFEDRFHQRGGQGLRVLSDLVRYHQAGTVAAGWVELDGERYEVAAGDWFAFRDHSWGVRTDIGLPATDLRPAPDVTSAGLNVQWSPMVLTRGDGERYEIHHHLQALGEAPFYFSGYLNRLDGTQQAIVGLRSALDYHPVTRRLTGGSLDLELAGGEARTVEVEVIGDTGFHLGTGLYVEFDGQRHGMWRGELHVDGEHIPDCTDPGVLPRIHQGRDCIVRVRDGDAAGYGIFETVITGAWPDKGLPAATSFI